MNLVTVDRAADGTETRTTVERFDGARYVPELLDVVHVIGIDEPLAVQLIDHQHRTVRLSGKREAIGRAWSECFFEPQHRVDPEAFWSQSSLKKRAEFLLSMAIEAAATDTEDE